VQKVIEQVAGVLVRNAVEFDTRADGNEYRIVVDSSATFISFSEFVGNIMISIHSPLLQEIEEPESRAQLLEVVNDLNAQSRFGRFVYYPELRVIALEYDLLGDDLQESELMNAVTLISEVANARDEELKLRLGTGRRYQEAPPADDPFTP
jgi:type III secretion system-like peptide-binding chaperone